MSDVGRFGVFLPSYVWAGDGHERARGIKEFARAVEDLGFDSLFVTDHLIAAKRFYSVSFLEPLMALAVAAGATSRIRLGTSILIMVGVGLETVKQIDSQLQQRHYEGLLR